MQTGRQPMHHPRPAGSPVCPHLEAAKPQSGKAQRPLHRKNKVFLVRTPVMSAPVKSTSMNTLSLKSAPRRLAFLKFVRKKAELPRLAPCRLALLKSRSP